MDFIKSKLIYGGRRRFDQLRKEAREKVFQRLGMVHLALIIDAGLIIMVFAPFTFGTQLMPTKLISLAFFALYVICDLGRLRFLKGTTISLGFPLVLLTLLADSAFVALLVATFGSLVSEILRNRFKWHLSWSATLRRAFFYAGHHAVAALGALIAYQLMCGQCPPLLVEKPHIPAMLVYTILYCLISMLVVWLHDLQVRLFMVPDEEPFVRVHFATLLLLPIPTSVFFLYNMDLPQPVKIFAVVGVLPPLVVLLFFLAKNLAKTEEQREQLEKKNKVIESLGAPANMAEMTERMLTIARELVDYRWGVVYSLVDDELRRSGVKPHRGRVIVEEACKDREKTPSEAAGKGVDKNQALWPRQIKHDEGILAELMQAEAAKSPPSRFFYESCEPTLSDPGLPQKTALIVFPIMTKPKEKEDEKEPARLIGLIALARPKRRFTTWDWESGQALSSQAGNMLLTVQRLDRTMRELSQKVDAYAKDREVVRQGMQELIHRQVDVARILAVVSERSYQKNLQAVLQGVVERKRSGEISLTPEMLTEIYEQVRDEAPGMPPLDEDILRLLQTVTSSLSLAFSFAYQFPDVVRGPAFKELYEFLLAALEANTVSRIIELDSRKDPQKGPQIDSTIEKVKKHEGAHPEIPAVIEEIKRLRDIVQLLKEYSEAKDDAAKSDSLDRALKRLEECEGAVKEMLRDPERFVFLQILSDWQAVITADLEEAEYGPACLKVSLRNREALPLDETTVGLVLRNDGPGVASRVVVQLQPKPDYEVLAGRTDLGTLPAGKGVEREFTLRPKGEGPGPLRLQFRITYHDPERKGKGEEFADLLYLREPPPRFVKIDNPYTSGPPLRPGNPTFFGREDIFNFIQQTLPALEQKMILALIGERRTGKTSILQQLPARLNDPHYIPIYVDCQGLGIDPGLGNFFLSLAEIIADGLEKAGISPQRLEPADMGDSPKRVFERQFLPEVRRWIGERVLLLTVDEFEELGERVEHSQLPPEIFPYLRHLIQHEEQLAFIFAGTQKVEELVGSYWSVLFNIAEYRKVGFLSREETIRLITEPVQPYGVVYDKLAVEEMLRLTACHPYFTQVLCAILVDQCNEAGHSYVTIGNVRNAVPALLERGHAHLTFLWQALGLEASLALAALAELRTQVDQVSGKAIADRLGAYQIRLDPNQITRVMERLSARDIVHEVQGEIPGDPVCYDYTAQLYSQWIRRYKPLSRIVEEAGIEPVGVPSDGGSNETTAE